MPQEAESHLLSSAHQPEALTSLPNPTEHGQVTEAEQLDKVLLRSNTNSTISISEMLWSSSNGKQLQNNSFLLKKKKKKAKCSNFSCCMRLRDGCYKQPPFKAGICHLVKAAAKEMSLTGSHCTLKGTVVDSTWCTTIQNPDSMSQYFKEYDQTFSTSWIW